MYIKFYCSYSVVLTTLAVVFLTNAVFEIRGVKPRRDETYPPPEFLKYFQSIHDTCVGKTGASEDSIKQFSDGETFDANAALKCYMNCIFHEVEVVDDDGEMHYEKLKAYIPDILKDHVIEIILACESHLPVGETQCDRAWSWHFCWKQTDPAHYFLP